jgi:uncharacterized protein YfeS
LQFFQINRQKIILKTKQLKIINFSKIMLRRKVPQKKLINQEQQLQELTRLLNNRTKKFKVMIKSNQELQGMEIFSRI